MSEMLPSCSWCGRPFTPRRTGGHDQHFCRPACRRALHAEARRWVLAELAAGRLSLSTIKKGLPATRALDTAAGKPVSVPETGPSSCTAPEALARFVIEIPQTLIHKLVIAYFELAADERDDVLVLLTALARVGRRPVVSKTTAGETVLSY